MPTSCMGEAEMKNTEANLLASLKKSPQFVIPIYQRTYSWTEKECQQLLEVGPSSLDKLPNVMSLERRMGNGGDV
jgi:hypothetical protein